MSEKKNLAFLERHFDPIMPTLNPESVLQRLEELVEQYTNLKSAFKRSKKLREEDYNLLNYYIVSAITCLEWHARGRFIDFISAYPNNIRSEDVQCIRNSTVDIAKNATTVAQLIGAHINISSHESYFGIFDRILFTIKSENNAYSLTREIICSDGTNKLENLFRDRHSLVHEININEIGPYLLRDNFSFDFAIDTLQMVKAVILALETEISEIAPRDFPNVTETWNEAENLQDLINDVEMEIESKLIEESGDPTTWKKLRRNWKHGWNAEREALDALHALRPVRWIDNSNKIKIRILKERYKLLKYISAQIDDPADFETQDNPD